NLWLHESMMRGTLLGMQPMVAPTGGTMPRPTTTRVAERPAVKTAALTATLCVAGACWVVAVEQMHGMDMGVATELGSFGFFVSLWACMMAAMMLPGAAPPAVRQAQAGNGVRAVPRFLASYLAVWALIGIAAYALYRPHGTSVAGAVA